jgi:hypothetical protein
VNRRLAAGEWEARGDPRADTRFDSRRCMTSVVPWLVFPASKSLSSPSNRGLCCPGARRLGGRLTIIA